MVKVKADLSGFERALRQDGLCPDTGKCHHGCGMADPCWRKTKGGCAPLSISGLNDQWELEVDVPRTGMTDEKVAQVCADYETFLREKAPATRLHLALEAVRMDDRYARRFIDEMPVRVVAEHMLFVAGEIPNLMAAGRVEKAMRWLGWLQGAIWGMGLETLDDAKKRNMPDPEPEAKPAGPFGPVEDWLAKVPSIRETSVGGVPGVEFIETSLVSPDAGGEPMQEPEPSCAGCDQVGGPMPDCDVCGRSKKPIGRSAPMESASGYCDTDCDGYMQGTRPSSLWPGERWGDSLPCIHGAKKKAVG